MRLAERHESRSASPESRASVARATAIAKTAIDVNTAFNRATSSQSPTRVRVKAEQDLQQWVHEVEKQATAGKADVVTTAIEAPSGYRIPEQELSEEFPGVPRRSFDDIVALHQRRQAGQQPVTPPFDSILGRARSSTSTSRSPSTSPTSTASLSPFDLEDDPEVLATMLSQLKSRVVELETELSAAAHRSSCELEQHMKLVSALQKHSLPNSPLKQAEKKVIELEVKLEEQTQDTQLAETVSQLEEAQRKVTELESKIEQLELSAEDDKIMLAEAEEKVQRLEQSQLREAAMRIKLTNDLMQAGTCERRSASWALEAVENSISISTDTDFNHDSCEMALTDLDRDLGEQLTLDDDWQSDRRCCC